MSITQSLAISDGVLPLVPAERSRVLGCGGAGVDYLATVTSFPDPDAKIRTTQLEIQGGGNVGNALTAAARLGLSPRIVTKVAGDAMGRQILSELEGDGIDTRHVVFTPEGTSPFTYIIVDQETHTRTCIHTPGFPPLLSEEISDDAIAAALHGCHLAYFDTRLAEVAIRVAHQAAQAGMPILVDAERPRDGLEELLSLADYVVCSSQFPQTWTGDKSLGTAMLRLLKRLPKARFVIVTLGSLGCAMLQRPRDTESDPPTHSGGCSDVDTLLETLRRDVGRMDTKPDVLSSPLTRLQSGDESESVVARVIVGTAAPLSGVVDTTGAGDAFIGSILYSLSAELSVATMLRLAATVAAAKCERLGSRPGLPRRGDKRLEGVVQLEATV